MPRNRKKVVFKPKGGREIVINLLANQITSYDVFLKLRCGKSPTKEKQAERRQILEELYARLIEKSPEYKSDDQEQIEQIIFEISEIFGEIVDNANRAKRYFCMFFYELMTIHRN
jgi:hypothetical protein